MGGEEPARLGWIGVGRMGRALVKRLLDAGQDVAVYNRTREKALDLEPLGATVVDSPADLADRPIVFTTVGSSDDAEEVLLGERGLLSRDDARPRLVVDSTTISPGRAQEIRARVDERGCAMLAAPVSGNPKVAASGRLTIVASGPREAWELARPHLELLARGVTYAGEGERARLVKVCHNLMLGVVAQCLAEITVLAEKGGVTRSAFLEFLNDSVMGSPFTRYKSPAYVNLDFTPTFTPELLLKDFHLGMEAAHEMGVSMPLSAATEQIVQSLEARCGNEVDFAALLQMAAHSSGLELEPEHVEIDDGLTPLDEPGRGRNGASGGTGEPGDRRSPAPQAD